MKKTFTLIVLSILTMTIWAQSPNKFSYQAVVRDADDNLVSEQTVGMQISILQSSATGTEVYTETHTPSTNANGLVTIEIGGGATTDDFSSIDWSAGPYFIKTEIDPAGSTNYTITGTSQLLSVPYAKYADKAGSADISGTETSFDGWDKNASDDFSGDYDDLTSKPNLSGLAHAAATPLNTFKSLSATTASLDSIVIEVPAAGYVYVTGVLSLNISHTMGTEDEVHLLLTEDKEEMTYLSTGFVYLTVPTQLPTNAYVYPVNFVKVFKVDSAGEKKYYMNARQYDGYNSTDRFINASMTAIYIPVAYGEVYE